jgi:hypothetical protein
LIFCFAPSCRDDRGQWQLIEDLNLENPRQWMEAKLQDEYKKQGIAVVQGSGVFGLKEAEASSDEPHFKAARDHISSCFPKHWERFKS